LQVYTSSGLEQKREAVKKLEAALAAKTQEKVSAAGHAVKGADAHRA